MNPLLAPTPPKADGLTLRPGTDLTNDTDQQNAFAEMLFRQSGASREDFLLAKREVEKHGQENS